MAMKANLAVYENEVRKPGDVYSWPQQNFCPRAQKEWENLCSELCFSVQVPDCNFRAPEWYPQLANETEADAVYLVSAGTSCHQIKTRSRKVTSVRRLPVKALRETRSGLSCRMVWSAWVLGLGLVTEGVWPAHPKLPVKVALPEPENWAVPRGADEWTICRGGLAHQVSIAESFLQGRCASFGLPTPCVSPICLVGREAE